MKPLQIKKHLFLAFSLFFFLLTLFIRLTVDENSESADKPYLQNILKNVNKELEVVIKENDQVATTIKNSKEVSFSNLLQSHKYPYYI